jgi:mannose-binding lectin 1
VRRTKYIALEYDGRNIAIHIAPEPSDYYYFSVYGVTTQNTDTIDLLALRTYPMSRYPQENKGTDVDIMNRKMLEKNVSARRLTKEIRRAKMKVTESYLTEKDRRKGVLTGESQELADALKIIGESEKRSEQGVTTGELMKFVEGRITKTIEQASKKVTLAADRFDETRLDLTEVWSNLRSQIIGLAVEAQMTMNAIEKEIIQAAKYLKLSELEQRRVERVIRKEAPRGRYDLGTILFWVSIVELVAYIIFFFWRRRKTHGFKKVD